MAPGSLRHPLEDLWALHLVTRGRKTGRPRRTELWFVFRDGAAYLLAHGRAGGQGTDWFRNLTADCRVQIEGGGRTWAGVAEVLPPEAVEVITGWFRAKYGAEAVRRWYEGTPRLPVRVRLEEAQTLEQGGD